MAGLGLGWSSADQPAMKAQSPGPSTPGSACQAGLPPLTSLCLASSEEESRSSSSLCSLSSAAAAWGATQGL